jgi:hypothetical protein
VTGGVRRESGERQRGRGWSVASGHDVRSSAGKEWRQWEAREESPRSAPKEGSTAAKERSTGASSDACRMLTYADVC